MQTTAKGGGFASCFATAADRGRARIKAVFGSENYVSSRGHGRRGILGIQEHVADTGAYSLSIMTLNTWRTKVTSSSSMPLCSRRVCSLIAFLSVLLFHTRGRATFLLVALTNQDMTSGTKPDQASIWITATDLWSTHSPIRSGIRLNHILSFRHNSASDNSSKV